MSNSNSNLSSRLRTPLALGLCCTLAAGLFIWFKLRLVTGMPRSANADPVLEAPKVPNPVEPKKVPQQKEAAPIQVDANH